MKPLHRLPLDDWFDDIPHPHDTMPIATDDENPRPEEEVAENITMHERMYSCLLYTSPSPRDRQKSRMPSSA